VSPDFLIRKDSPRTFFESRRRPQGFTIIRVDRHDLKLVISFDSGTELQLHFWRFNLVIDRLIDAKGQYVMIGSRIDPDKADTVESLLYQEAMENGYPGARLRTAAFVCDILVLCGFAEYGYTTNPDTGRTVQAIKWISNKS